MKKLWHASIEVDMYVYAEDEAEAYDLVSDYSYQELNNVPPLDWMIWGTVDKPSQMDGDLLDSIPWGEDVNDRTCRQILDAIAEEEAKEAEEERLKAEFDNHPKLPMDVP